MSDLKNKYLFMEVTKSPPCASLCGPEKIMSKIENSVDSSRDIRLEVSELGDVMEIRLTGIEGRHRTSLLKMNLLYAASKSEYEPMALQSSGDSLILSRTKDAH